MDSDTPLQPQGLRLDRDQAIKQLELLNYKPGQAVYLRCCVPDKDPRQGVLQSDTPFAQAGYSLPKVIFPDLPWHSLEAYQAHGYGSYLVVNGGGHKDSDVRHGRAIYCEWDDRPKQEQWLEVERLEFPKPTFVVETRKSLHFYWTTEKPLAVRAWSVNPSDKAPGPWKELQLRLIAYTQSDKTLINPSRLMRLAGSWHIKIGEEPVMCQLQAVTGEQYSEDVLRNALPPVEMPQSIDRSATLFDAPEVGVSKDALPLAKLLSKGNQQLLADGVGEGGRNESGYKLARDLIGCELFALGLGLQLDSTARQLLGDYAARCAPALDEGEVSKIYASALKDNPGPAMSQDSILKRIAYLQRQAEKSTGIVKTGKQKQNKSAAAAEASAAPTATYEAPISILQRISLRYGKRLRLNQLKNRVELDGEQMTGVDYFYLRLLKEGIYEIGRKGEPSPIGKHLALDCLAMITSDNAYDPVIQYLEACYAEHGDSTVGLLDDFATANLGATEWLHNAYVRRTLIAAVARRFQPGCEQHEVLILKGAQALGKSRFFQTLFGRDFYDASSTELESKDSLLRLHSTWAEELGELTALLQSRSIEQLKQFISNACDTFRSPYGSSSEPRLRRFIMVASTNREDFFGDATGNRRFLVIPVGKRIDLARIANLRDKLWAAAVALYKRGEQWWLTEEEKQAQAADNEQYLREDSWLGEVTKYVEGREFVTTAEVLKSGLGIETAKQTYREVTRITDIFKQIGWKRATQGKKRVRGWQPANDLTSDLPLKAGSDLPLDHPRITHETGSTSQGDPGDPSEPTLLNRWNIGDVDNMINAHFVASNGNKNTLLNQKGSDHSDHPDHPTSIQDFQGDPGGDPGVDPTRSIKSSDLRVGCGVRVVGQDSRDLRTGTVNANNGLTCSVIWSDGCRADYEARHLVLIENSEVTA